MKNFWKWILGIVVILVVLFVLGVGARLLMVKYLPLTAVGFDGIRSPMIMGGRGFVGIGMPHTNVGFMSSGWLIPLVLIGLVIYGAYRLGARRTEVNQVPPAPAPVPTCASCGAPVQEGWNHCASCGSKL